MTKRRKAAAPKRAPRAPDARSESGTKHPPAAPTTRHESGARRAHPAVTPGSSDTRRHRKPGTTRYDHLVLVVDDFKDGRDLVVETLAFAGFPTVEAGDGLEALAKCRKLLPAIVLMDLSLPGLDGWEVTRRLKGDAATRHIKVIALTAHAQTDALDRARRAGADDVMTKPCLPSDIVERVRELLGISRKEA